MPQYTGPRGSGFTSLKQYLELNPEQAQRMGTELVSDVDAKGAATEKAIGGAMSDFGSRVNAATLRYDPTANAADAAARAGTVYSGPTGLADEQVKTLGAQAVDAQNRATALGSDAGRATLLSEKYGTNGGYTPGAAGLDAFLAGRGAGERGQTAGKRWGGLRAFLDTTVKGAQHLGADAAATTANSARRYGALADTLRQQADRDAAAQQRAGSIQRGAEQAARLAPIYRNQDQARGVEGPNANLPPTRKGPDTSSDAIPPGFYEDENGILRRGKP